MTTEEQRLALSFPQKPVTYVRGDGALLHTDTGARHVDLGGASHGVANFGHAHPRIVAAITHQAGALVHTVMGVQSPARALFLERLHSLLPDHLTRSCLVNSGTEAVEAALKYVHAATGRTRIVAARGGFHGRTLGALALCHKPTYRKPFQELLRPVEFVRYGDAEALEAAVNDETAAVILEPVQGEGGVHCAGPDYLLLASKLTRRYGSLLVVDEVQTGLGRTGRDLAIQESGVEPDILLLGKSLAGGLPIGVAALTETVAQSLPAGAHGSTFGGSPLVCAAAAAALEVLADQGLSERARLKGEHLKRRLDRLDSDLVREVRGCGLMVGLDLRIKVQPVLTRLLDGGFLALPAGSTVLRFLPPLVIERQDLDRAVDALAEILADPLLTKPRGGRGVTSQGAQT